MNTSQVIDVSPNIYECSVQNSLNTVMTLCKIDNLLQLRRRYLGIIVQNCTIFLCSLDVGHIDDQCRGPSIKGKDHLAG